MSRFTLLNRKVVIAVKDSSCNKKLVDDRYWLTKCVSVENDVFLPLDWIEHASCIEDYTQRLRDLHLEPAYRMSQWFDLDEALNGFQ